MKGFMNKVQVNYVTKFQLNNEHILRLMHQEDCTT